MYSEDLHSSVSFIETLRSEGGKLHGLDRHLARLRGTVLAHGGTLREDEVLHYLSSIPLPAEGLHRLTLTYDSESILSHQIIPYQRRAIHHLQLCPLPPRFTYHYKYADRSYFLRVKAALPPETEALFLLPDGRITDTTFTNILLELEDGSLVTPACPLLKGTQRGFLIEQGLVYEQNHLTPKDLARCRSIRLINAMLPLEEAIILAPDQVYP